jgi:hypothetical protein
MAQLARSSCTNIEPGKRLIGLVVIRLQAGAGQTSEERTKDMAEADGQEYALNGETGAGATMAILYYIDAGGREQDAMTLITCTS